MSAPNFHPPSPGLTVGEIATLTGAVPQRDIARDRRITGLAPLDRAGPGDLSFLDRATHAGDAETTDAGVCLTIERFAAHLPPHVGMMFVKQPYRAFVEVACKLYPDALRPSTLFEGSGTVPGTFVHPTARLEAGVRIDPGVVIGARAEIGAGTVIAPAAVIGPDVRIGRDCAIGTNATVTHSLIGDRVIIHPGARIGQDGFGFVPGPGGMRKVPQLGRVIIQDDVEIGANSTIDRGSIRDTIIGEGTKIDNLVQIAHNVVIGRYCLLAGLAGVSGSVTVGDFVMMGGSAGVTDNVIVGEGAQIGARASVMSNIPAGGRWLGTPARPARAYLREVAVVKRLVEESRLVDRPDGPHNDPATDDPT